MSAKPAAAAAPRIERLAVLGAADLASLNLLVAQSGWNQNAQDWRVFFSLGSIDVIRDRQGSIIASGAVLPFGDFPAGAAPGGTAGGTAIAWISMILVTPAARGGGLGMRIFHHCLRVVEGLGRSAVLDATPAGERIYRQFGFQPRFGLSRWQRTGSGAAGGPAAPPGRGMAAAVPAQDAAAFGVRRDGLLGDFLARPDTRCIAGQAGFAMIRGGRIARQIGPIVAGGETAAIGLLAELLAGETGTVFIDIHQERAALRAWLEQSGFALQRGFLRMARDAAATPGDTRLIHAIAGPEFG